MDPLYLEPYYLSTIWAGDRLTRIRGVDSAGGPWGIAREVCAYPGARVNKIAKGEFAGFDLEWLIKNRHNELMGSDPEQQLIRLAYMDSIEDLSIQVHPNEEYAVTNESDREKSESWYIIEAEPDAYVIAGTTTNDVVALRSAAACDGIDAYARKVPVQEGDFILIEAGCMHACGKNMLALEVGSFGGITYRICDYGRGRKLNIDRAFDVLDTSLTPKPVHFGVFNPADGQSGVRPGIRHRLFAVDVVDVHGSFEMTHPCRYEVVTAVKGDLDLVLGGKRYPIPYTYSIVVPAISGDYLLQGVGRALVSYHPLDLGDKRQS